MMVEIMQECWKGMLVDMPNVGSGTPEHEIPLPSPADLLEKILIKVKYTPPKPPGEEKAAPTVLNDTKEDTKPPEISSSSSSSEDGTQTQTQEQPEKKKKILDSLSQLGVYTKSYHFKSFDQPGMQSCLTSLTPAPY